MRANVIFDNEDTVFRCCPRSDARDEATGRGPISPTCFTPTRQRGSTGFLAGAFGTKERAAGFIPAGTSPAGGVYPRRDKPGGSPNLLRSERT